MKRLIALLLLILVSFGCNREHVYAGKRLDVEISWDYLHIKGKHRPQCVEGKPTRPWIPTPSCLPDGDPRSALIAFGALIGICAVVTVVNEVVHVASVGEYRQSGKLINDLQIRMLVGDKLYVSRVVPGKNRLVLTDEMEIGLRKSGASVNVYCNGDVSVNYTFRVRPIKNPETVVICLNGDGHVYVDDECVD